MNTLALQKTNASYLSIVNDLPLEDYLYYFFKEQDLKDKTISTYNKVYKQFFKYLSINNITNPTRIDIINYKESLKTKSPYTISTYITAVRKFFEWTEASGYYTNIAKGIKGAKLPKGFAKDTLTMTQIKDLLSSINLDSEIGKRDYALLNLLIMTGLRTIEVERANIEDIRQVGNKSVLYIQGKGRDGKDDFVILTNMTLKPINDYLKSRIDYTSQSPLFIGASNNGKSRMCVESISRIIKTRLRSVGIDSNRLTAHSLRHTAITLSLLAGSSLQEACSLARHTNIATTQIYAHNIERLGEKAPEYKIESFMNDSSNFN